MEQPSVDPLCDVEYGCGESVAYTQTPCRRTVCDRCRIPMHIISAITVIVRKMHGEMRGDSGNFANAVMAGVGPGGKGGGTGSGKKTPETFGFPPPCKREAGGVFFFLNWCLCPFSAL